MLAVDLDDNLVLAHDEDFRAAARSALVTDDTSVAAPLASIIVLLMSSLVLPLPGWVAVVDDRRCGVLGGVCVRRCIERVIIIVVLLRLIFHQSFLLVIVIIDSLILFDIIELSLFVFVFGISFDVVRRLIYF